MKVNHGEVGIGNHRLWCEQPLPQTGRNRGVRHLDPFSCSVSGELSLMSTQAAGLREGA